MTEPQLEVQEEFNTQHGVIKAQLLDDGTIKFYREGKDEPYHTSTFDSYEEGEKEFFSLDSQIIEKAYEPNTEKYYTVETVCFHQVKAESREEALDKVTSMDGEQFIGDMISPESQVTEVEEE